MKAELEKWLPTVNVPESPRGKEGDAAAQAGRRRKKLE